MPYHLFHGNRLPHAAARYAGARGLTATMAQVLVAGESWQVFSTHTKGFDSFFTADYGEGVADFRSALESAGHVVEFQPNHVAAARFPDTVAALNDFDAVVLSDIGSNT